MITSAFAPSLACAPLVPELVAATAVSWRVPALEKAALPYHVMTGAAQPAGGEHGNCCGQGISAGEWDDLFGAVAARLRKAASEPYQSPAGLEGGGPTALAAVVLECVDAMGLLRVLLAQQRK